MCSYFRTKKIIYLAEKLLFSFSDLIKENNWREIKKKSMRYVIYWWIKLRLLL